MSLPGWIYMCLTLRNQLTLIHDLLYEQITYNTVHLYEYKQIKKIIQQLMKQQTLIENYTKYYRKSIISELKVNSLHQQ